MPLAGRRDQKIQFIPILSKIIVYFVIEFAKVRKIVGKNIFNGMKTVEQRCSQGRVTLPCPAPCPALNRGRMKFWFFTLSCSGQGSVHDRTGQGRANCLHPANLNIMC